MAPDVLLGCETPRLWTKPLRELTPETSLGWEAIAFAEDVLRVTLLPWQRWLLIHALELTTDGRFRFRTLCILVARQNGKSTFVLILALWRMFVDGAPLIIGTAQNLDLAEETWTAGVDLVESIEETAAEIAHVDRTNGKKALRLVGGNRYKIAAASRRGGRGLSGDLIVLDELREHQTWDAWAAVTKTTMARPRAQIVALSNAGDASSVVLRSLRIGATESLHSGNTATTVGLFEWSAPEDCDLDDPDAIAQANPALGHLIHMDAIDAARETDPEPVYRTEVLCQWVSAARSVIDLETWLATMDPDSSIATDLALAVDVSIDREWASIAAAGVRPDGTHHVECLDRRRGTGWVVERLRELNARHEPVAVVVDPAGPAASLIMSLEAGEEVDGQQLHQMVISQPTGREYAAACGQFYDAAVQGKLHHLDQTELTLALGAARRRSSGDQFMWDRKAPADDISALVAATLALWGSTHPGQNEDYDVLDSVPA